MKSLSKSFKCEKCPFKAEYSKSEISRSRANISYENHRRRKNH